MTVKEIETRSGMTRANIRFYEAEGLLTPTRLENGYRDYSEENLAALLRIRLLRGLHVPLDEIRALQDGGRTLGEVMERQIDALAREKDQLGQAAELCRVLRSDGASYDTLDAPRYLALLDAGTSGVPSTDAIREQRAPWRRFWARAFDLSLYGLLILAVTTLVFHAISPISGITTLQKILFWALDLVLLVLLEPVFLSRLGTTPGKWLMGLRVTDPDGRLLRHDCAYQRTVDVLIHGMGFNIPLVHLYCSIRCLVKCEGSEPLFWEHDSVVSVRDMKTWRYIALGFAYAALIGLMALAILFSWRMPHRGELTAAELSENYNRAAKLCGVDIGYRLEPDGTWIRTDNDVLYVGATTEERMPPALRFDTQDGYVIGVSFETEDPLLLDIGGMETCLVCAFVGAQEDAGLRWWSEVLTTMYKLRVFAERFTADVYGVRIESDVEFSVTTVPVVTYATVDDIVKVLSGASEEANTSTQEMEQTTRYVTFSMRKAG